MVNRCAARQILCARSSPTHRSFRFGLKDASCVLNFDRSTEELAADLRSMHCRYKERKNLPDKSVLARFDLSHEIPPAGDDAPRWQVIMKKNQHPVVVATMTRKANSD